MKSNYQSPGPFFSVPPDRREHPQDIIAQQLDFEHRLRKFVNEIKRLVHKNWVKPQVDRDIRVVAGCRLHREGYVTEPKLFYSCGIRSIDYSAMKAIEKTIPFPAIPQGLPDYLDIQFEFEQAVHTKDFTEIAQQNNGAPPPRVKKTTVPTLRLPNGNQL